MEDSIIPLQNCPGLPFQERDADIREKVLPSRCPSHRVHQLQDRGFIPVRHLIKLVDNTLLKKKQKSDNTNLRHIQHNDKRAET
jgi:hypothetical protein